MTLKQYILYRKYVKRLKELYKGSLSNTITTSKPMFRALYDLAYECEKEEKSKKNLFGYGGRRMTREESIADIRDNIKPIVGGKSLDMAIKALEQEPCEDCISRQSALDALEEPLVWTGSEYELGLQSQWKLDVDAIKSLSSVTPAAEVDSC